MYTAWCCNVSFSSLSPPPSVSVSFPPKRVILHIVEPTCRPSTVLAMPETKRLMYSVHSPFFSGYINPKISSHFSKLQFTMVFAIWYFRLPSEILKCIGMGMEVQVEAAKRHRQFTLSSSSSSSSTAFLEPSEAILPYSSQCWRKTHTQTQQPKAAATTTIFHCFMHTTTHTWININTDVTCKQCVLLFYLPRILNKNHNIIYDLAKKNEESKEAAATG